MPSIKGTASVTDNRALNKRLASVKFPANFAEPCNVQAVNRAVMTTWIEERITELLGFEDEIVQSTAVNLFLPSRVPDGPPVTVHPKKAQIHLEGFLGEGPAAEFAAQVYTLLLDAQASRAGVPKQFVEEKKKELEVQKAQAAVVGRPRGPYQQQQQQQGPPRHRDAWRGGGGGGGRGGERGPPRHVAERGRGPPPARRSVSPERGGGNGRRDEFGRTSRPADMYRENERPPYDTRRGDNRREGGGRRGGYDRREESPPPPPYPHTHHHHHRRHHHRDRDHDRRPPRGDDRYPGYPRADEHDQDTNNNPDERHRPRRRSRSRSPPRDNSRSRRRSRSLSSSSSSCSSSSDSSRSSRGGGYRQRR